MFSIGKKNKDKKIETGQKVSNEKYQVILKKIGVFSVRYFDALVAVFVLIVFLLGFVLVINPKYKAIIQAEEYSQEDLEAERNGLSSYVRQLSEYKSLYQQLSSISKERIDKMVSEGRHKEDLFAIIESMTRKQGAILTAISIQDLSESDDDEKKKKDKDTLSEIEISLSISGLDYFSVKKMLGVLETNLMLMDVESLEFDVDSKKADLIIKTYILNNYASS